MSELTIRHMELTQSQPLISLWMAAFPTDSKEYIIRFLGNLPPDTIILAGEYEGNAATMLFLLPATASFRGKTFSVRYLYAGCTHPQYRGRGFYRELMSAASKTVQAMGEDAIYLHPADEALTQTYQRLGYRKGIVGGAEARNKQLPVIDSADEYALKRANRVKELSQQTVFWDVSQDVMRFFLRDAIARGAIMRGDEASLELAHKQSTIEYLESDCAHGNEEYCLWLPIGDTPLLPLMEKFKGAGGMVGD